MIRTPKSLIAVCLLAASSAAMAATTAELTVKGQVVPTACEPSFANAGVVQYQLSHGDLNPDATLPTSLQTKSLGFTIQCTSATPVATTWVDNKPEHNDNPAHANYFGFGKDANGDPIGRLWVQHPGSKAFGDNQPVDVIHSTDKTTWSKNNYGQVSKQHFTSFAAEGETTPGAYSVYSGDIQLKPTIRATEQMDMSGALEIDSSLTMEVVYL
ncbi:DUF1120 domain-containing protein [Pseudomonas sp. RIT-To-2]|uniref:DUF1120 domain-containing protein n=1 Tax=Pseudomonas sp. RIT-To-2 TaxID=3462541 RepID=UPI0024133FFA